MAFIVPHQRKLGIPLTSTDVHASYVFPSYWKGKIHSTNPEVESAVHVSEVGALEEGEAVGVSDG